MKARTWSLVVLFAIAMAWLESAVVFYLRSMIDRIEPYQANPLPNFGGLAKAELVREAATLIMLFTVGWLAGTTRRQRLGYALIAFGIWDIFYYVFLKVLTPWPRSLFDWDILFLIPLPWWGPVLAPVCIAALMILWGTLVTQFEPKLAAARADTRPWLTCLLGGIVALYVFMADSIRVAASGEQALRDLLPEYFNWPLFSFALVLMSAPVVEVIWRLTRRTDRGGVPFDTTKWLVRFRRNRETRVEPDWSLPVKIRPEVVSPLVRSLEQFQLGDGGGPASLIAHNAELFRNQTEAMQKIVDAWFAEEREHARLLGRAVDRFGGVHIASHWSFTVFCQCRRALGVTSELQILLLTEIVSTAYYRVMRRHCEDPAVRAMCSRILRDEARHISFHCDRLAAKGRTLDGLGGMLWTGQFWIFAHAAATMLWVNHGPCLTALGGSCGEYYHEVRRELRRFGAGLITRTARFAPIIEPLENNLGLALKSARHSAPRLNETAGHSIQ